MKWGNKIEWLNEANKSRGLAILFKNNISNDILKTYQDLQARFLFSEIKVKNSFLTIANIYDPNVDDSVFLEICLVNLMTSPKTRF